MSYFEALAFESRKREFLNLYRKNKLYFPPNFKTTDPILQCALLNLRVKDIDYLPESNKQQCIRFRITYFSSKEKSFLGKTFASLPFPVSSKSKSNTSVSVLLMYGKVDCLNVAIELSIGYSDSLEDSEAAIGYTLIDISKVISGPVSIPLNGASLRFELLKSKKFSKNIIRSRSIKDYIAL